MSTMKSYFNEDILNAIEKATSESEKKHRGELRFVIESELPSAYKNKSVRERAIDVFSTYRIWDTEENNGVLIYVLCKTRNIEIVADRGINKYAFDQWEAISKEMQANFASGKIREGSLLAIARITDILSRHFPYREGDRNELPDRPALI